MGTTQWLSTDEWINKTYIYTVNKKEWSADMSYNKAEPWKYYAIKKAKHTNTNSMIPFTWNVQKRQTHRDRKQLVVGNGWHEGREWGMAALGEIFWN